ncbi:LPXTG cell wall anchor domain-containing protein [Paraflavitalea speifideaquila]|uniref:LPXTG cell wall anchor domain-containing protein n=1 Tax=Paraflavitalea speifideaquila TaxID=3076558 RepID=UPI0028F154C4|nr:LPXTG cell wall anchor domain-containing protein [Paraflavitalea speifideiaquila]
MVKVFIDRDKIVVGDSIVLTLDVRAPLGETVTWFNLDTIPHFEFLDKGMIDTVEGVDGKKWVQQLTITSYDSGYWQIPNLAMKVAGKTYYSDSLGVQVGYANTDLAGDYKDIKEIEDVPNTDTNYIPWVIGGITLLALVMLLLLLRKKKLKTTPALVVTALTPLKKRCRHWLP